MSRAFSRIFLLMIISSISTVSLTARVFGQETTQSLNSKNKVECSSMREEISLSISFTSQVSSPLKAKEKFEARLRELDDAAHELKFKKWQIQNSNLSVSSLNYGNDSELGYQLAGSVNYITDDADKTFLLVESLTKRGYTPNMNVSRYRTDTCSNE